MDGGGGCVPRACRPCRTGVQAALPAALHLREEHLVQAARGRGVHASTSSTTRRRSLRTARSDPPHRHSRSRTGEVAAADRSPGRGGMNGGGGDIVTPRLAPSLGVRRRRMRRGHNQGRPGARGAGVGADHGRHRHCAAAPGARLLPRRLASRTSSPAPTGRRLFPAGTFRGAAAARRHAGGHASSPLLVCVPCGLGAAIYLSEYAHPRVRNVLKPISRGPRGHSDRRVRLLRPHLDHADLLRGYLGLPTESSTPSPRASSWG